MTSIMKEIEFRQEVAAAKRYIGEHSAWFLALGAILILAGIAAIAFPLISTIATKVFLGWIFLAAGIAIVAHGFRANRWSGTLWSILIGVLYLAAGAYLSFFPLTGIVTLTLLLAALFVAEGIAEIVMAVNAKPRDGWIWLLLSGLVAIAVGVMITLGLPDSSEWAIGTLAGINLVFTGLAYVFLALMARDSVAPTAA